VSTTDQPAHRYTASFADAIERRWQERWAKDGTYVVKNPGEAGFDASRPKFYCLDMFPYPSGAGLHVGHPEGYTATDIICRYKRMKGFNVLHPMGWDAFGLPAEQYAIQTGVHPAVTTRHAIDNFRRQLQRFGFSYDWSREFGTIDPEYYTWTQWIFLRLYDAWFDESAQRARPIAELEREFASGARPVRLNPRADEIQGAELTQEVGPWSSLDASIRRRVLDSYRLAYQSTTTVNWCPKLGTVLANDEVIDGRSERGGHPVLRRPLKQWMFRITAYAERLRRQLDDLDWPESTKTMQREWIGRSEGAEIRFRIACGKHGPDAPCLTVFTTRPDTLFGATYMVVAPEHPLVDQILRAPADRTNSAALREYVDAARRRSDVERMENKDKTGVDLGVDAINPANGKAIPIWVADYVLMGYGTGAIMAVPSGDERDFEFARKFRLPIVRVVAPSDGRALNEDECFSGEGVAINSTGAEVSLDGLATPEAKATILAWLEKKALGTRRVNFKLRDWTFSRQRYWGEPFPIVFDDQGRPYPVRESSLPVRLPELADYAPVESDTPQPLLAKASSWVRTTAGAAGVDPALLDPATPVTRETNTMPGSAGSSWYAIRYCDARNPARLVGHEAERYWMEGGVDLYLGGSEHAVGHLLYARFWQNVLFDLGYVTCREPFRKLFHQGLITSFAYQRSDKSLVPVDQVEERAEGEFVEKATGAKVLQIVAKMSKSLKNVVNPDDVIGEYGADTFRLYEMYMGPLDASKPWNPRDISGLFRFLQRAWRLFVAEETGLVRVAPAPEESLDRQLHRLVAKVGADIERLSFNTAIAAMIEFVNSATAADFGAVKGAGPLSKDQLERFALVLSPFAPHLAQELWQRLGRESTCAHELWPAHDPSKLVDREVELPVSVQGKVRSRIVVPAGADAKAIEAAALADPKIKEQIEGKAIKKVIVVPGKMVNVVV
jgi:leucyl-tRNA synthetase